MGREKGKREKWTVEDMELLEKTYSQYPFKIPQILIDRHGRAGCYTKAERMELSHVLDGAPFDFDSWPETTKAYLAGIIDGEGTVTLCRQKHHRATGKTLGYTLRPIVTVSNTEYKLLNFLKNLIPHGFSYDKRKQKLHWKQAFQWAISSNHRVYGVLKAILPYLVIKKEKAEEVMAFIRQKHPKEIQ